jgi:hypothetical protein
MSETKNILYRGSAFISHLCDLLIYFCKWTGGAIIYYVTVNMMDEPLGAPVSFFEFQYLLLFQ